MRFSRLFAYATLALTCLLVLCPLAQAQYRTSIQGVVTDSTGAVIPGATLTLTNPATNEKQVRTSNDAGVYNFNALAAARFRLEVVAKGFEKKVIDNLEFIPDQANALNIQLGVGAEVQTINVDASALPALETQTATTTGVVSENQVQHMPSFGRDVMKLALLAPGAFGDNAQGNGGGGNNLPGTQTGGGATGGADGIFKTENGAQVIANGNQTENNGIMIDGISTTSAVWGGSTVITPTEDSVDNVKISTNAYDAEYGRFTGAQIQITSKSGTNQFHGSLFFAAHRAGLNAYQRFNGNSAPLRDENKFNQMGGSIGGPIWKNKLFGFFAYETIRANSTNTANGWYDTAQFDAMAPAGSIAAQYLSFPGSAVSSSRISSTSCAQIGLVEGGNCATIAGKGLDIGSPLTTGLGTQDFTSTSQDNPGVGNGLDGIADIANYTTANPTTKTQVQYNGRLDANISGKDRVGFAIYWVPVSSTFYNGTARPYNFFHHDQINDAFSVIWNHTFSPTFLNEARANAAGWRWNEIASNSQQPVGLPQDNFARQVGSVTLNSFGASLGSDLNQWTYSYKDVATKVVGRHTIKFGGEVTRLYYLNGCAGCGAPIYSFFNIWDFLNDAPKSEGGNGRAYDPHTGKPTTYRQDDRENLWGFFVHDDFKLRSNLTINVGLRYSYFGPLSAKQGNMYVATPGAGANYMTGLTVHKGDSWNAQKGNFGPQIGFAWSPRKADGKFVVRGGYGLNYNQEEIAISAGINSNPGLYVQPTFDMGSQPSDINPGIVYSTSSDLHTFNYPSNPNAIVSFGSNGLPTTCSVNVGIYPTNLPTMLTHHYSLDTQYDLGHQFVATLGYQGSLSRNTYFHSNPNAIPAAKGYALNPQIGSGDYWAVNGSGNYNAMLLELKHQFSHQFMADAQFQWAKSMDTSSAPYSEQIYAFNPSYNYGRSDYNVGKAFKVYGMWQPVFFRGSHSWIEKIAGGWSISGILNIHSGFPWNPVISIPTGSLYCGLCNYSQVLPAAYLGGAGSSTSNDQFKTGSNYPNGGAAYFSTPTYTAYTGSNYGSANPPAPGIHRNSLTGPGYRDVDMTLAKSFGLPNIPGLGENAKFEFRADAYNLFNNLNFDPTKISNDIHALNFGVAQAALGARTVSLTARFSF